MTTERLYDLFVQFPSVSTDSRKVRENSIFFALRGEKFDGNKYAASALLSGAAFAVVDRPEIAADERYILTDNVLDSLQKLAVFHRRQLGLPLIAVTGSNGKTTTKELVASVLLKRYRVEYTRGNLNNHIGVPLTLLSMSKTTEIGVVEMGANHPGEIDFLCRIAQPDYGLITNVGKAHLEGFGNLEGVISAKSELYRFLESGEGTVFINGDNRYLVKSAGKILRTVSYGTGKDYFQKGELVDAKPFMTVKAWFPGEILSINTRLVGSYNLENVLAAIAVGRFFNVAPFEIKEALEEYHPSNNRSQWINTGSNNIIMDAYNANPDSMMASISNFLMLNQPNKVVILGDMLELGEAAAQEHQTIVDYLAERFTGNVFLAGKNFRSTVCPPRFVTFPDTEQLALFLKRNPLQHSLILIKASHGMQMEKLSGLFTE